MKLIFTFYSIMFFLSLHSQEPEFGDTLTTFDIGSLTPTPDRSIAGLEFAEGYYWATGFDPDDYWQHKLYKISADGSELVETFSYGIEAAGWKDLAYDGEFLYVTDLDTIRQISPVDGQKTGVTIPAPFYYNFGLAYNPITDHFFVNGEGGSNIYEIDRTGQILGGIANYPNHYTGGLAIDTASPGGPFLWTWSNEVIGYDSYLKASQISLTTYQFTGLSFYGTSISNIIVESAGGADIIYDYDENTLAFATVNIRNGNANDQMEYAILYNITNDEIPGPQIEVDPVSIQNELEPGDSLDVEVTLTNEGMNTLFWSAYIETPDQDTIDNLGDLLYSFNGTENSQNNDNGLRGITFLNNRIWINGRNYPNQTSMIYEFNLSGELIDSHPYNSINSNGFTSITSDGEYLYGMDTYAILKIDPETFSVEGYIENPGSASPGFTYDPQTGHFWSGNGNGAIYKFNSDGEELNFYLTPYDIQGLAWDQWSPGGPFLWAWVESESEEGSSSEAIRLNPQTCLTTGVSFSAADFSNNTSENAPKGAVITDLWEDGKVTFLGLQNIVSDSFSNTDFVGVYDLDVIPPPDWIELVGPTYGQINVSESGNFVVKLRSLMEDTLMTAIIRIANNTIMDPELVIPVNFTMLPSIFTNTNERVINDVNVLGQNFPNPFIANTRIPVNITSSGVASLKIYNSIGVNVANIHEGWLDSGYHEFKIALPELKSGMYYYILQVDNQEYSNKMLVLPQ